MPTRDTEPVVGRVIGLAAAAILVVILIAGGLTVRNRLFFDHTHAFRASERLLQATRTRQLTADEFDDALALLVCGESVVESRMQAVIPLALDRAPEQRPAVLAHLERLSAGPSESGRQTRAGVLLKRLTSPPPDHP